MSYRSLCRSFYGKAVEAIFPGGLRNAQYSFHNLLLNRMPVRPAWLDLGCGHAFFGDWMTQESETAAALAAGIVGIDLDFASLRKHSRLDHRVIGDGGALPFAPESFDLVTANMVVEHLADPARVLAEVWKVLRPGGRFVYHTPNLRNFKVRLLPVMPDRLKRLLARLLEGRAGEDVYPTFYRMNTPSAAREFAGGQGFVVEELHLVEDSASTIMLGPVVLLELLITRVLLAEGLADYRSNLVVSLRKPGALESQRSAAGAAS